MRYKNLNFALASEKCELPFSQESYVSNVIFLLIPKITYDSNIIFIQNYSENPMTHLKRNNLTLCRFTYCFSYYSCLVRIKDKILKKKINVLFVECFNLQSNFNNNNNNNKMNLLLLTSRSQSLIQCNGKVSFHFELHLNSFSTNTKNICSLLLVGIADN